MPEIARSIIRRSMPCKRGVCLTRFRGNYKKAVNRSRTSNDQTNQYEKIHELTNRLFAGAGWSRDGSTTRPAADTKGEEGP